MNFIFHITTLLLLSGMVALAAPPSWIVAPSDYQYNASITCVVYVDAALNENESNILGAFVDDTVRGVATPIAVGERKIFFLTVYSNKTSGDTLSFFFYDALMDTVIEVSERIPFTPDAQIGDPIIPFQLHCSTIPGLLSRTFQYGQGWNIISVPLLVSSYDKSTLFPSALSDAFLYQSGYQSRTTLQNGIGYWLKLPSDSTQRSVTMIGFSIESDTIAVSTGWNIIGSISSPVLTTSVAVQGATVDSRYYKFHNGYVAVDTLEPGNGYWVKVSSSGSLIMQANSSSKTIQYPTLKKDIR